MTKKLLQNSGSRTQSLCKATSSRARAFLRKSLNILVLLTFCVYEVILPALTFPKERQAEVSGRAHYSIDPDIWLIPTFWLLPSFFGSWALKRGGSFTFKGYKMNYYKLWWINKNFAPQEITLLVLYLKGTRKHGKWQSLTGRKLERSDSLV